MAEKQCTVDRCSGKQVAKSMCGKHYRRILRSNYPECSIEGCENKSREGDLCSSHAHRKRRHGDPLGGSIGNGVLQQFIINAVDLAKSGHDECIIWPHGKDKDGYGTLTWEGKKWKAHRLALVLSGVPEDPDLACCHSPGKCHNPSCVNANHLRFATMKENKGDQVIDGTVNAGSKNGQSKLNESAVFEIRSSEKSRKELAAIFGVSKSIIDKVIWKQTWTHVQDNAKP